MEMILNLTQHPASAGQIKAGVEDPHNKEEVRDLLTFGAPPAPGEMIERAHALADLAVSHEGNPTKVMIGGAPFFMSTLEAVLKSRAMIPVYAFSRRESVEEVQPDGSVKKTQVFRHLNFIEVVR